MILRTEISLKWGTTPVKDDGIDKSIWRGMLHQFCDRGTYTGMKTEFWIRQNCFERNRGTLRLAGVRRLVAVVFLSLACAFAGVHSAVAIDPLYQPKLQRLSEILGALYFLRPLCGDEDGALWRTYMEELIVQEQPDEERRARIVGSFNQGYNGYARLYVNCTPSARVATQRYLAEGEEIAKEIHTRYTE